MEGDLSKFEWGRPYSTRKTFRHWRYYYNHTYQADYKLVEDYHHKAYWVRGDIIILGSGYYGPPTAEWRKWFQPKEDYLKYLHENRVRDKRIPLYARSEYALLLSRYKWTKHKDMIYRDYGTILMMLTGSRQGHILKIYASTPFDIYATFPYGQPGSFIDKMISKLPQHKEIREIIEYVKSRLTYHSTYDKLKTSLARSIFVEKMVDAFGEE